MLGFQFPRRRLSRADQYEFARSNETGSDSLVSTGWVNTERAKQTIWKTNTPTGDRWGDRAITREESPRWGSQARVGERKLLFNSGTRSVDCRERESCASKCAGGYGDFDFAQSKSIARRLFYAPDAWEGEWEPDGAAVFNDGTEYEEKGPETWYRALDRPFPRCIALCVLNWLNMSAQSDDWGKEIANALKSLAGKGTNQMSQSALAELSLRQDAESRRKGELTPSIYRPDAVDVGDASMQQLTIGNLEFAVLDYGDRLMLPMEMRKRSNEWHNIEKNQCSIIHLAAGLEWHLQNRPNRSPLRSRAMRMDTELRGVEFNRALEMIDSSLPIKCTWSETVHALTRDIGTSNHDRDFRFWPLLNGDATEKHGIDVPAVELNTSNAKARVYNYQKSTHKPRGASVIYLLAHRGHMKFMKQSRPTPDTRWENGENL